MFNLNILDPGTFNGTTFNLFITILLHGKYNYISITVS